MLKPDYIFESSWEVCNKVGGIYTVLSSKANTLQQKFNDRIIFIGPDSGNDPEDFIEDKKLFSDWAKSLPKNIKVKTGRWDVPGTPPVILVSYKGFSDKKSTFYYEMWEYFGVDSSKAYGDYDESCLFAYAVGVVIENFYHFHKLGDKNVAALFNEWMLGMGALYVQKNVPSIATLFTTHATTTGRSIAGNNKPLYAYLDAYNGGQMAGELNVEAKHSLEKQTAAHADCFTTVSDITALECKQLLDKEPDIVTPNGFEKNFIPKENAYIKKREEARSQLVRVVEKLTGKEPAPDAFFVATSGRYEYRNKGIDVFIEAMNTLRKSDNLNREMVAFIMVPAWVYQARADLKHVLENDYNMTAPMQTPFLTHWLNNMEADEAMNFIFSSGFTNGLSEKLKIVFVPCYLDGHDGIFNKSYYDLLIGMDATVFASYYEPWGYTPLESIAFGIPTITTNLAGFGKWVKTILSGEDITEGVAVIKRTDDNYPEVVNNISESLLDLTKTKHPEKIKNACFDIADQAQWSHFIKFYDEAFDIAFRNARKRNGK